MILEMTVCELFRALASAARERIYLQECLIDQFLIELASDLHVPPLIGHSLSMEYFWLGWTGSRS